MKLIDKSVLVAEIEKRIKEHHSGYLVCLKDILSFLDTLEVKEVDLEKEIDNYLDNNFYISETWGIFSEKTENEINQSDLEDIAKHFYKLGLEAQKGE